MSQHAVNKTPQEEIQELKEEIAQLRAEVARLISQSQNKFPFPVIDNDWKPRIDPNKPIPVKFGDDPSYRGPGDDPSWWKNGPISVMFKP